MPIVKYYTAQGCLAQGIAVLIIGAFLGGIFVDIQFWTNIHKSLQFPIIKKSWFLIVAETICLLTIYSHWKIGYKDESWEYIYMKVCREKISYAPGQ